MNTGGKTIVAWYIVFTRASELRGVMRFLKRDFTHVYAMRKSEGGQFWIIVDPMFSHLKCTLELVDDYPHPRCYTGSTAIILPVKAFIGTDSRWTLCIFNCVEVVKALLGIRRFWIWTPYQLYQYLRRA